MGEFGDIRGRDGRRSTAQPGRAASTDAIAIDFTAFKASLSLDLHAPDRSSRSIRQISLSPGLTAGVIGLGVAGLFEPILMAVVVWAMGFAVFSGLVAWRLWLLIVATTPGFLRSPGLSRHRAEDLPVYSVLIALYKEGNTISGLAGALRNLDWPEHKLDVILLVETGDSETRDAIDRADWPEGMRLIELPPGQPRTKPRALNYGLDHARGAYVCVYDAEDRPHPLQLKAAHTAFQRGPDTLACVQAPLAGDNHRQSWLALHWTLEYAVQFGLLLPALSRLGLPILLGGTSNHFRRAPLVEARGWDAWNVTEDADLGVRLSSAGYRAGTIAPPTFEEAPETLRVWTSQRSRWLKGFLQTWVVLTQHPIRAIRELGLGGFLSLQAGLLGTCLAALLHAPLMMVCLLLLASGQGLSLPAILLMSVGYGVNAMAVLIAPGPKGMRRWLGAATLAFYWPLQSAAALRALYGWVTHPHFWAKTPHGMTSAIR